MIVQNFSQHDIGLSHHEIGSAIIPMGREGKDEEGNDVIVPGEAEVSDELLGALKSNPAVQYYFTSGKLVEGGAVKAPSRPSASAVDPAALKAAEDAVAAATAKLGAAPDAKSKASAQAELDAANAALAALQ